MKLLYSITTAFILARSACSNNTGSNSNPAVSASSDTGKAELAFAGYEHHFVTSTCGCTVPKIERNCSGNPAESLLKFIRNNH